MIAPYMKFYVADYKTDSKVRILSLEAKGLYIEILAQLWLEKEPYLPIDENLLARILGLGEEEFTPAWEELWQDGYEVFMIAEHDDDMFTQKRLLAEWNSMVEISGERKKAQAIGVAVRKQNQEKMKQRKKKQDGQQSVDTTTKESQTNCKPLTNILQTDNKTITSVITNTITKDSQTLYNTDTDIDSYSDSYLDSKLLEPKSNTLVVGEKNPTPCPHQEILKLYHEILPNLPKVKVWNKSRTSLLRQRWTEDKRRQSLSWWKGYFTTVSKSDFLTGKVDSKGGNIFVADMEWLIRPNNLPKVIEGRYTNRKWQNMFESAALKGYDECAKEAYGGFGALQEGEVIEMEVLENG